MGTHGTGSIGPMIATNSDTLARLEAWKRESKHRTVCLYHTDGLDSQGWACDLKDGRDGRKASADDQCGQLGHWTAEETIRQALDAWERL